MGSIDIFEKGFQRSTLAGGGFFKSLYRGFSGLAKSNKLTRGLSIALDNTFKSTSVALDGTFKSMSNFFKKTSFYKGFSRARIAGDSFFNSMKRGFSGLFKQSWYWSKGKAISGFNSGFKMLKTGFSGALGFITKKTSSLIPAIKGAIPAIIPAIKGAIPAIIPAIKGIFSGGIVGAAKGLYGAFKGFGTLLSGGMRIGLKGGMMALRATLLGSTAGLAQIAFSVIDGIFGAFRGFQKTGERFEGVLNAMGKSTKDLTWGMYASSTISGALVGILDGLTFGLLRMSGAAEFLETWISLSTYVLFSFVEGVVDGLMYGIGLVKPALTALYDTFASLGESLLGLFNSITSIFGAEESKTMSAAFATIYPILKTIGWFVGMIVGAPIGAVLWTIVKAVQFLVWVIKLAVDAITGIVNIVKWAINGIVDSFKWLYNILVGNSIVPDTTEAIMGWWEWLGGAVLSFFATLPMKILTFLVKLPFMIGSFLLNAIVGLFGMIPSAIQSALYSAASAVGMGWLFDKIAGTKGGKSVGGGEAASKEAEATGGVAEAVEQTLDPSIKLLSEALTHGAETIYLSSMAARLASMPLPLGLIGGGITSGLTSLMGGSTTGSVASTAPSTSIDERVQRDLATTEPSVSSVGGPELGSIAGTAQTQVEKLTEMVGLLTEMVMLMQPSTSGSGGQEGASTLTNYVATSPPKYYKWSTGKHNQTANKGIANIANIG